MTASRLTGLDVSPSAIACLTAISSITSAIRSRTVSRLSCRVSVIACLMLRLSVSCVLTVL
jgi:hypothetical protein